MRWRGGRQSTNVEDRRGMGAGLVGGGIGVILIAVIAMLFGVNPGDVIQGGDEQGGAPPAQELGPGASVEDTLASFVSVVLADTEDTWNAIFQQNGMDYRAPRLVLFSGAVQSACGFGQAAMGPFYCPTDQKVYIDLGFYDDLRRKLNAPGDFAQAYVIAHEVGHHVQNLLGVMEEVAAQTRGGSRADANAMSVRQELQADCLAGVWAHHAQRTRDILEPGDVEEALGAASAIGDDRLQRQQQGHVTPDSFTHGTSEQRVRWFRTGFENGDMRGCDTFGASRV